MALKTLSAIALLLATTTANALTIDPQAPCASPAADMRSLADRAAAASVSMRSLAIAARTGNGSDTFSFLAVPSAICSGPGQRAQTLPATGRKARIISGPHSLPTRTPVSETLL